jgi:hypothetical protein
MIAIINVIIFFCYALFLERDDNKKDDDKKD